MALIVVWALVCFVFGCQDWCREGISKVTFGCLLGATVASWALTGDAYYALALVAYFVGYFVLGFVEFYILMIHGKDD